MMEGMMGQRIGVTISGADDAKLECELGEARKVLQRAKGREHKKRQRELLGKGQRDFKLVEGQRQPVEGPGHWIGHRLGEVVRRRASKLAPAGGRAFA